jgi:class 3 adenylate cyclase
MSEQFMKNNVYKDVYLVFIDASGHSSVVKNNPLDVSEQAFDLLFDKIKSRLDRVAKKHHCNIAVVWSWLGDGGMIAIHDNSERTTIATAIEFMKEVLNLDLPSLQSEFKNEKINGELHIRIAAHKGTIKYTDEGQQGFIHSPDINWGAHLEKATPKDAIAISKEIYSILQEEDKKSFIPVGVFEDRETFVHSVSMDCDQISLQWTASHGFNNKEVIQCYLSRISEMDKSALIDAAKSTVIDFGTTLNTCSNYLFSTARPVPYRDAVCRLLERGGSFICYMITPDSNGAKQLMQLRNEDTDGKLKVSLERFQTFKKREPEKKEKFKVYQYDGNPNFAAMVIDPNTDNSVCLYSPYLNVMSQNGLETGRADMPHYLVSKHQKMYDYVWRFIKSYIDTSKEVL